VTDEPEIAADDDNERPEMAPDSLADNVSFARPDSMLEMLGHLANNVGLGMGLTLVTAGGVVTGSSIPHSEYLRRQAESVENANSANEGAAASARALAEWLRDQAKESDEARENEKEDDPLWMPRYIHLADARVHDGNQYLSLPLWRGRLTEIVGWSFGSPE
jgi:hypothetical protein